MTEIIYKWDNDISIIVPAPSCISCVYSGSASIDENDCVCLTTKEHHFLTDKCERYRMSWRLTINDVEGSDINA